MEVEDDPYKLQNPEIFFATTLTIEALLAFRLAFSAFRRQITFGRCLRSVCCSTCAFFRFLKPFRKQQSQTQVLILEEARALRNSLGRKLIGVNLAVLVFLMFVVQCRVMLGIRGSVQPAMVWTLVATTAWMGLAFVVPQLPRTDVWYVVYHIVLLAYLHPTNSSLDTSLRLVLVMFSLLRLPAILTVERLSLVVLCNVPFIAVMAVRVGFERIDTQFGGRTLVITLEVVHLVVLIVAALVLKEYLMGKVEQDMEKNNAVTQLNAASSLLQLTCDAVVELDSNLRLTKHSRELAAMLLRDSSDRPATSLEGTLFTDLMPKVDVPHALTRLTDFRSTATSGSQSRGQAHTLQSLTAHAFHTRLVDSCSTKLQTEVLQVMYTKRGGETCHLVGLRDFTDTKPYAHDAHEHMQQSMASSAWRDDDMSVDSLRSMPIHQDHDQQAESWIHMHNGTLFLDVDVEQLRINAASAQLTHLVGCPTNEVFHVPHTLQLLERIHSEARMLVERGEAPPSRVFSFEGLPAKVKGVEEISGTMRAIQTQTGINVLMTFQVGLFNPGSPSRGSSRRSSRSGRQRRPSPSPSPSPRDRSPRSAESPKCPMMILHPAMDPPGKTCKL